MGPRCIAVAAVAGTMISGLVAALHHGPLPVPGLRMPPETWQPLETGIGFQDRSVGFAPKPTPPPHPEFSLVELAKRQVTEFTMSPNTCGFKSSSRDSGAFTCGREGASCSNRNGFIGCCSTNACTAIKTSCVPHSVSLSRGCDSSATPGVLCCSASSLGFCYSYVFSSSISPSRTLTLLVCDSTSTTGRGTLLDFPLDFSQTATKTSTSTRTSTISRTSQSSKSSQSPPSSPSTSSTSDAAGTPTDVLVPGGEREQQQQVPPPVGAIVGGVVGGAAVIAIAAVGIFFMARRANKKYDQPSPPPAPAAPVGQTFPPTSPFTGPSASPFASYNAPYSPDRVNGAQGGGGASGFAPQGYPTAAGYMMPPHQQHAGGSPYSNIADSMYTYPSTYQGGGSPMPSTYSPEQSQYTPYRPSYSQQQMPMEPKPWGQEMPYRPNAPPGNNQAPQELP